MNNSNKESREAHASAVGRRDFLTKAALAGATVALGSVPSVASLHQASSSGTGTAATQANGRRKLGTLEVSSIGLGVQNMSRKYETTVPYRPEMIKIIRAAYDRGVTFFDTAEAYGPFECERILGESVAPFRDKVVITSKFGWNIDPETGQFRMGLNSGGPGLRSRQSGKELVLAKAFLHPETERQATEVGRYGSGVWLKHRSIAWPQVPCAEQWLTGGETQLIPFGRVSSIAQLGRCLQLRKRAISEEATEW